MTFLIIAKKRTLLFIFFRLRSSAFFIRCFLTVVVSLNSVLKAQFREMSDSAALRKRHVFTAVPVIFYTPETRFGFGASAIYLFNFKSDTLFARKSTLSLGFAYTQNKQTIFNLPYNLFLKNRAYHFYGELSYMKFFYNFYGVGNDVPESFVELYGVEFPRLRVSALKKVGKHFYTGIRYAYDKFSLFDLDTTGLLIQKNIRGSEGAVISGLGWVALFDSRDDIFYPSRGWWWEFVFYRDTPKTGASYTYNRITFDISRYFSYRKNILALNAYTLYSDADLPFYQMAMLGGAKRMRGYYEGRYRDNNALVFQAEYRRYVLWWLGFAVFGNAGQVAHRYDGFDAAHWRFTYGAGLRLITNRTQKLNLRVDFAIGNGQLLPYFTIGEAF